MSGFTGRENQLFDVLQAFNDHELEFVVIGGYAVSAFQHRFSVDADLVITAAYLDRFTELLRAEGYEEIEDVALETGRFVAYRTDAALPVTVDLMVDAVESRETGAAWRYDEIVERAKRVTIEGSEASVTVRIPAKALLMAMKLHGGRSTDARDVIALAEDVDFDRVAASLHRGDGEQLRAVLARVQDTISDEGFADAFKGVFSTQELPAGRIEAVDAFLDAQLERLD